MVLRSNVPRGGAAQRHWQCAWRRHGHHGRRFAIARELGGTDTIAGVEFKTNYFRPVVSGTLSAPAVIGSYGMRGDLGFTMMADTRRGHRAGDLPADQEFLRARPSSARRRP